MCSQLPSVPTLVRAAMYVKAGTQSRTQYIDVTKIASALGPSVCSGLLGMHAFTGCDSVSTLAGRGKLTALKMLKRNEEVQCMFKDLGSEWTVSEELNDKIETFTCQMYAPRSNTVSVNELRYNSSAQKRQGLIPISCHHAQVPFRSTPSEPITSVQYGKGVSSLSQTSPRHTIWDGNFSHEKRDRSCRFTGWTGQLHQKQFWSFSPVVVRGSVDFLSAHV